MTQSFLRPTALKILSALLIVSTATAQASEITAYQLPITRDGQTQTRVAYNFWSGEYPGPVINVNAEKPNGKTRIKGLSSLRGNGTPATCEIANGLYHPWSTTKNSVINFYSLTSVQASLVAADTDLEGVSAPTGSRIVNIYYQSEGYCGGTLIRPNGEREELSVSCDALETDNVRRITPADEYHEQWLYVACADGKKVFIQDEQLLKQTGNRTGRITEYGSVGL